MRSFIRRNIKELEAYIPEPQSSAVVVNANESPYNLPDTVRDEIGERIKELAFNRYPDPLAGKLREKIASVFGLDPEQILLGSGLDEVLMMLTETFVGPNDTVITHVPSFSMYEIWTKIADGQVIAVPDLDLGVIDTDGLIDAANTYAAKLIYLCRPNNPTGTLIPRDEVEKILNETNSLLVLDEAYADFAEESLMELLSQYENLIVLRTMSKAYSLPSARCGFMAADKHLVDEVLKVKGPYNLNTLTQIAAQVVLEHRDEVLSHVPEMIKEREALLTFLEGFDSLTVYPSRANFIYFLCKDAPELQNCFKEHGVLVKYDKAKGAFRVSIGTPVENKIIRRAVESLYGEVYS